jgi:hypothetical protein
MSDPFSSLRLNEDIGSRSEVNRLVGEVAPSAGGHVSSGRIARTNSQIWLIWPYTWSHVLSWWHYQGKHLANLASSTNLRAQAP